jgi:hypothetical protein
VEEKQGSGGDIEAETRSRGLEAQFQVGAGSSRTQTIFESQF